MPVVFLCFLQFTAKLSSGFFELLPGWTSFCILVFARFSATFEHVFSEDIELLGPPLLGLWS
jgi:hypothetical protein